MSASPLIDAAALRRRLAEGEHLFVFDCSHDLMQPQLGRTQFEQAHIPGARYVDLGVDLSAAAGEAGASGGRHPLPTRAAFAAWLGRQGVTRDATVVVYDRQGANFCGRLWWMLEWVGVAHAQVLDGGWAAWLAAGGASAAGPDGPPPAAVQFEPGPARARLIDRAQVEARLGRPEQTLIDARAPARYRGETEPLDPIAGHIPGALNRPFAENLGPDGRFKAPSLLRTEFESLLAGRDGSGVVHHCGSGVSAVPNVIAMALAGYGITGLFAGSWSEWCADPSRPVARG